MPDDPKENPAPVDAQSAEEFVRAFARSQHRILAFVQTIIPLRQDAEEVLQETSIVLWKKWPQFDPQKDFASWACGVARLEVFRHLRQRPKQLYLSEEVLNQVADLALENLASETAEKECIEALSRCLEELPTRDQEMLKRRYRRGESAEEIASAVGLARSTVFEALQKTRSRLLQCVKRRIEAV